jgi:hypothetical protein
MYYLMTVCITTLTIMGLIVTFSIMYPRIMDIIMTITLKYTQHKDT